MQTSGGTIPELPLEVFAGNKRHPQSQSANSARAAARGGFRNRALRLLCCLDCAGTNPRSAGNDCLLTASVLWLHVSANSGSNRSAVGTRVVTRVPQLLRRLLIGKFHPMGCKEVTNFGSLLELPW